MITLEAIAARAGVAKASVSYALRNHPKIPDATRQRVQQVARELGYRPNPRVSTLMAHIRRAHVREHAERIAFVWVHTSRAEAKRDSFLRLVYRGAGERAHQMGFKLEQFFTGDAGMTNQRLEQILRARGIVGVVFSPVITSETALHLAWDWRHFAAAVIGNVTWTPELHHAGHHHFLAMRLVLLELGKLGCRRPAALVETTSNDRGKHAWEAAFLAHHPVPAAARSLVRVLARDDTSDVGAWVRRARPDALIVSTTDLLDLRMVRATARAMRLPIVTLYWTEQTPRGIGGIDQCYDRVAGHAVDLVVAQLNSNETGAPDLPRIMLFPGRWIEPNTS
ncbi:MAG: LacI family DNA-binding transcriptional regulator [Verrucomicrobia bacterium]|nr:LacI family DNA-binding transcriptional regulator [Verrucomicrobiota bacterium]